MAPAHRDQFLHELIDAFTAICGWAQLVLRGLPPDVPEHAFLEELLQIATQTADRIQEERRRIWAPDPPPRDDPPPPHAHA